MQKVLNLVPTTQATCVAAQSGNWSDPATWGGKLPATDDSVWVPAGVNVLQDVDSPKLRKLFVQGTFGLSPGAICKLWVDLFVSDMGSTIAAGAADAPFTGSWSVLFADYGPLDPIVDPWAMGRGFQCMGNLALYGTPVPAYIFTNGNAVGDTTISLQSPCTGWNVGDKLVLPGVGWGTIDDDECCIKSISQDLLTITLTAPLKFAHGIHDREGGTRPMFAANISKRSIHFDSENTAVGQRGHLMMMRYDNMTSRVMQNASVFNCGRTDKSKPVSDPDGLGGGLSNPRGRYALHFHKGGPAGMEAMLDGLCVVDSPGWGPTNHDDNVCCNDSVVYKAKAASYVGEIGTETGCYCRCVSIRNTAPFSTANQFSDPAASPGPLADWGKLGHGFFDMCGAIQRTDCIATGSSDAAYVNMGLPFQITPNPATVFDCANLPAGYTYSKPTCPAGYVPRNDSGLRAFGCHTMMMPWQLNINGGDVPIGQSKFSDIRGEAAVRFIMVGYLSGLDLEDTYGIKITPDYANSTGIVHSGVSSFIKIRRSELYGFDLAVQAGTINDLEISDIKHRCLTGVLVNPPSNGVRNLAISNVTRFPLSPVDMAYVLSHWNAYNHQVFGVCGQPKEQKNVAMLMLQPGTSLYSKSPVDGTNFPQFTQGYYGVTATDSVTLDGMPLYYVELAPDWPLANVPNVPAIVKGLTNQQMWDQYKVRMGAVVLPADAVPSPGNLAMQSRSPATVLPDVQVEKWHMPRNAIMNYQPTNKTSGFTSKVKDNLGNDVPFGPVNLTDKAWNIVPVPIYGGIRGVFVYCDTAKVPVVVW